MVVMILEVVAFPTLSSFSLPNYSFLSIPIIQSGHHNIVLVVLNIRYISKDRFFNLQSTIIMMVICKFTN